MLSEVRKALSIMQLNLLKHVEFAHELSPDEPKDGTSTALPYENHACRCSLVLQKHPQGSNILISEWVLRKSTILRLLRFTWGHGGRTEEKDVRADPVNECSFGSSVIAALAVHKCKENEGEVYEKRRHS